MVLNDIDFSIQLFLPISSDGVTVLSEPPHEQTQTRLLSTRYRFAPVPVHCFSITCIHVIYKNTRIQDLYFEFSAHIGAYIEAYNT